MIFDIAQLIVFLATVAAYGYYLYLIGKVKGFFKHVQGTETPLVSLMGLNVFTSGNYVKTVIVRQLA